MNRRGQKLLTQLGALVLVLLLVPVLALVGFAEETDGAAEPVCYEHGDVNGDAVVDSRDAVYTLYHAVWADTDAAKYPVSQDCDFNSDGAVDGKDAIWLLYASLGIVDGYELEGTVHAYYAPEWSWAEDCTAVLSLRCGCGNGSETVAAEVVHEHQDATCTAAGWDTYTATAEFGGETYENAKTVTIAATDHALGERTCTEGTACSNEGCTYTLPALGHSYQVDSEKSTAATCTTDAVNVYVCQTCGDEKTVTETGSALGHSYGEGEVKVEGCESWTVYTCANCDHTITTDPVVSHLYTVTLTAEPNCTNPGTRTYTCQNCGDSYAEEVAANGVHVWDDGVTADSLTTYTCTCCGTTKTAVVVADTTAEVSKETLQEAEVQLENASIALDEATLEGIQGEDAITIEVVEMDAAELGLNTSELPGEIVEGKVYDFTMKQGETEITEFKGSVTVSIPYTLQAGDDVDCIDVWFIDDNGNVACYEGTYSNGQVTFTTTHFSYYTVTRLTAAERCAQYGHVEKTSHLDPACDTDGYDMVSCQRCGNVEKTVLSATGHDYTETRQEATCTADGSVTKVCACGYESTTVLPALGHAWGEPVVEAATCTAAGCETYTCAACGESYTTTLAQLAHSYEVTGEVVADCTTDGYTTYQCASCGDTYTESTGSATGHDYQAAEENWVWAEDHSQAAVTLVCSHNAGHTKTLNAAVTKTSEDCLGHVVYTATASFNNVAYTSVKDVDTGVESHTPSEEWSSFGLYHYHYCIRCGLELDRAEHNLTEQTVVTEPTCVTSGSAVATCTVCDTQVTFTLPATGTHSYVSGACAVCGSEDTSCNHVTMHLEDVDLTGFDICEGGTLQRYSCDCGRKTSLQWNLNCTFEHVDTREAVLPDGHVYQIERARCADCGLTSEYAFYTEVDTETCDAYMVDWYRMSQNGIVVAEGKSGMLMGSHNAVYTYRYEMVDLAEYGLCDGEVLRRGYCYCGEYVSTYGVTLSCSWEVTSVGENTDVYTCSVCGAVRTTVHENVFVEENCMDCHIRTVTYELDGKVVYTYTDKEGLEVHSYQVTGYEMSGEACEDGVTVTQTCSECGDVYEYFTWGHPYVKRTETDLSQYGFCADTFYQEECPCGEYTLCYLLYHDTVCSFELISSDEENQEYVNSCTVCGLTHIYKTVIGEKDENCRYKVEKHSTYTDADGNKVASGTRSYWEQSHNMKSTATLLEGSETCEDGAQITRACTDCDYSYFYTTNSHESIMTESYDLSELGLCGGKLVHFSCACGQEEDGGMQDEVCSWEHYDYYEKDGVDHSIQYCAACGAYMEWQHAYSDAGLCLTHRDTKVIVTLNETVVAQIAYDITYESHDYVYETELDGESCEDGYEIYRVCQDCGNREHWGSDSTHSTRLVMREVISEGQICADVAKYYYSCACGQEQESHVSWDGPGCTREGGYWDEATNCWVDTCTVCGASCYQSGESEEVEGSCERKQTSYITYKDENGEELFSYTQNWSYYDHLEVSAFEMVGTTCEEGYYRSWTCAKCGESSTETSYHTDCITWLVGNEVIYDAEDICGPIIKRTHSNPCGTNTNIETAWNCSFDWMSYDSETEMDVHRCSSCGLIRKERSTFVSEEGSCNAVVTVNYILIKDDVELTSGQYEYTSVNHSYVYSGQMQGESCDDGYYLTRTCSSCGDTRTESNLRYGHETFRTAYYDLTDYGLCGGEVWRESCLCGQNYSDWFWNLEGCSWVHEGTDSETGLTRYKCFGCNTVRYSASTGEVNRETCRFEGTYIFQLFRDDEQLLNINGALRWEAHDTYAESFTLNGETCADGYIAHEKCLYCEYTYDIHHGGNDHSHHRVRVIDLSAEEYGLCGGELTEYRCACGEEYDWNWSFDTCEWTEVSGDDGLEHYYCGNCNTYRDFAYTSVIDRQTCTSQTTMTVKLTRDDKTLLDMNETTTQESHSYEATYEGTCSDESYKVIQTCVYCGKTLEGWTSGHGAYVVKRVIDMGTVEGPCGTSVEHVNCPCGENSWVNLYINCADMSGESWEEQGTDGYTHEFYRASCQECGFSYVRDRHYEKDTANCMETCYETYSFYTGEELIYACGVMDAYDAHSYGDPVLTLMEGAETCEDGVYATFTCQVCGYVQTNTHHYHATYAEERIDLQQYGAVCDTELVIYSCACGQRESAQLEGTEMCDMDWMWEDETPYSQYNSSGRVSFWDQYQILTCAVSDPQCGFKIRHVRNWEPTEESGCVWEEQVTWLLGYDETAGTSQAEIVIKTGNREQYHNYTTETATETQEDGTSITTETHTCADCGSTYVYTQHNAAEGDVLSHSHNAVNTQDNGFDKKWYQETVNGAEQNGYLLENRTYTSQVHADGTEYWSQSEYAYNFENGACERTVTYTDSYGGSEIRTESHFHYYNHSNAVKERTCSQYGDYTMMRHCYLCDTDYQEYTYTMEPIGHSWYDRGDGTYGCEYCGMISDTGASGSIVLEDLSNYATGDEYIAGYWNRGNVEFTTYVCVYLVDAAEGVDDEIVLQGIETTMLTLENDGMTAISFSWSGADAAADAAVAAAGHTGEYYVRLVFVPVNGEDTLDYAVTFVPEEY